MDGKDAPWWDGLEIIDVPPGHPLHPGRRGVCMWLVPDLSDDVPDAVPCESFISGPACAAGHPQVAGTVALNELPELN